MSRTEGRSKSSSVGLGLDRGPRFEAPVCVRPLAHHKPRPWRRRTRVPLPGVIILHGPLARDEAAALFLTARLGRGRAKARRPSPALGTSALGACLKGGLAGVFIGSISDGRCLLGAGPFAAAPRLSPFFFPDQPPNLSVSHGPIQVSSRRIERRPDFRGAASVPPDRP